MVTQLHRAGANPWNALVAGLLLEAGDDNNFLALMGRPKCDLLFGRLTMVAPDASIASAHDKEHAEKVTPECVTAGGRTRTPPT